MRIDKRKNNEIRKITITANFLKHPEGSVLITCGNTKVICTASIEDKVPPHLKNKAKISGWLTAEYSMLPRATNTRNQRQKTLTSGRTQEISRLIGRSLRSVVNLETLGERTITLDCDVIQADGGTRTASITGAFIALSMAVNKLYKQKLIKKYPIKNIIAAVSVGIVEGKAMLDLCYKEDVNAEVDMNVVMTDNERFIEIQGTGEESTFDQKQLNEMLNLAKSGIKEIIKIQKKVLKWK